MLSDELLEGQLAEVEDAAGLLDPEQVGLQVRADQHVLGVLVYQLVDLLDDLVEAARLAERQDGLELVEHVVEVVEGVLHLDGGHLAGADHVSDVLGDGVVLVLNSYQ